MTGPAAGLTLALNDIEKRFGDVLAVNRLKITFAPGEVHALLGENGAGKSTLMNIAAGFLTPDSGEVVVGGKAMRFGAPKDAIAAGIGMVHQHFRLVEQFTVGENLAIGAHDVRAMASASALNARASAIGERYGMPVDPKKIVGTLSVGERQRVEILRTLSRGAQVLILDEPTAVLTPEESDQLCANLRSMAADGATIIFISHKLNEVLAVADRVSVMRKGILFATKDRRECDLESLAKMMFDEYHAGAGDTSVRADRTVGTEVLRVSGLSALDDRGASALSDVSFAVKESELVGVVGVAGNGQQELEQIITGLRKSQSGTIEIDGHAVKNVKQALRAGMAHIPEDRLGTGLVPSQPIWRNAILRTYKSAPIARGPFIRTREARAFAGKLAASVDLSTSDLSTLVQHLSGGNAQKLLAGRELAGDRRAVVAVNPTQGLDVRAAEAVRAGLVAARDRGLAVLLISADLDEVLSLADRLLVLYEGRIAGEFSAGNFDRDLIGRLMGGGKVHES
ncbi:MAG: ABC transporter ATP-binding protein [Actinomycetes bacterium]